MRKKLTEFYIPEGVKVILKSRFENGENEGWHGKIISQGTFLNSKGSLELKGKKLNTYKSFNYTLGKQTFITFAYWAKGVEKIFLKSHNCTQDNDFGIYIRVDAQKKWKNIIIDYSYFTTLVKKERKFAQVGDEFSNIQFIANGSDDKSILRFDNILIYTMTSEAIVDEMSHRLLSAKNLFTSIPDLPEWLQDFWKEKIKKTESQLNLFKKDTQDIDFKSRCEALAKQIEEIYYGAPKCCYFSDTRRIFGIEKPVYTVGLENSMVRISDYSPYHYFQGKIGDVYQTNAPRRDYEAFQLVIMPFAKDLKRVTIEFSDLVNIKTKRRIDQSNLYWWPEGFVHLKPNYRNCIQDVTLIPDPLMPAEPFDVNIGKILPVWVEIFTAPEAEPGDYEGTITIKPINAEKITIHIKHKVWDFSLPLTGNFRTQCHLGLREIEQFYRKITPEIRHNYYGCLLQHRFSPTSQYTPDFSPHLEDIEWCKERGATVYILGGFSGREISVNKLKNYYKIVKQHDILNRSLIYIGDETKDFDLMINKVKIIRKNCPGLKIMIGGSRPRKELKGYIDIYDPYGFNPDINNPGTYGFNPEETRQAQREGDEVFWYVCCDPDYPYPNVQMDDLLIASRSLFWITWMYRITGFEYYYMNIWSENIRGKNDKKWPEIPWDTYSFGTMNGDGQLIYPGPTGKCLSSLRLKNIRDGIEDWEAFKILDLMNEVLKDKLKMKPNSKIELLVEENNAILNFDSKIVTSRSNWSKNPSDYLHERFRVNSQINKIYQVIGKVEFENFLRKKEKEEKAFQKKIMQNKLNLIKDF